MRSGYEVRVTNNLKKEKVKFKYEPEKLPYILYKNYIPDLKLENGIYVEMKGRFTSADRTKMLAVKKAHKNLDIRMLFQYNNYLRKGSKTRYSDWCDKNGFTYAFGEVIPLEWIRNVKKGNLRSTSQKKKS
jgi:hypothetical protein